MSSLFVETWSTSFTAVLPGASYLQALVAAALGASSTAPMPSSTCISLPEISLWPLEPALPASSSPSVTDRVVVKQPGPSPLQGGNSMSWVLIGSPSSPARWNPVAHNGHLLATHPLLAVFHSPSHVPTQLLISHSHRNLTNKSQPYPRADF